MFLLFPTVIDLDAWSTSIRAFLAALSIWMSMPSIHRRWTQRLLRAFISTRTYHNRNPLYSLELRHRYVYVVCVLLDA